MEQCQDCHYYRRMYYQIGRCLHPKEGANSKFFPEDGKTEILVHASFGCIQWLKPTDIDKETL